jgi:hypothetical protein
MVRERYTVLPCHPISPRLDCFGPEPTPATFASVAIGLGRVKTKSDLVVMPSGRQIFAFFALRMTVEPKIPGAVIPRRVFTQVRRETGKE